MKFTQEIKDKWLEALKSGKYIQGTGRLRSEDKTKHCCLGVLCEVRGFKIKKDGLHNSGNYNPYEEEFAYELYTTNDETYERDKRDYSNVIPLIEKLVVE